MDGAFVRVRSSQILQNSPVAIIKNIGICIIIFSAESVLNWSGGCVTEGVSRLSVIKVLVEGSVSAGGPG